MSSYTLNASFEMIGGFWPFGKPDEAFTGTLSSRNGNLRLVSAPEYRRLDTNISVALRGELSDHVGTVEEPARCESIVGFTRERKCTFLTPVITQADSSTTDIPSRQKVSATVFERGSAVMGLHLESTEAKSIESAAFHYNKIHHVLPVPWNLVLQSDRMTLDFPTATREVFKFSSVALQAEISCEVLAHSPIKFKKGGKIRSVPRVTVTPRSPQSLEWFFSIGDRIENFFTLLVGTSVALTKIALFQGDEIGWLVRATPHVRSEKINPQSWAETQNYHEVAGALAAWFAVPNEKRTVEKLLLRIIRKSSVFPETEFLSLAQALEAFARIRLDAKLVAPTEFSKGLRQLRDEIDAIWGCSPVAQRCSQLLNHANEPSFSDRLKHLYDLLSPPFALRFLGERSQFARTVAQTRNHLTHPGITKQKAVVADAKPLFLLNQRLHAFLRCLMLLDLGLPEARLINPIKYQAAKWR